MNYETMWYTRCGWFRARFAEAYILREVQCGNTAICRS